MGKQQLIKKQIKPRPLILLPTVVVVTVATLCMSLIPLWTQAAPMDGNMSISGLSGVLDHLYEQMIPMASKLIRVAQAIAGFAALWYIAFRVWKHIARAEPIDFYPLLRPFALGIAILFFLPLVHLMNGILQPTVTATRALAGDSQKAILLHIAHEQQAALQPPPAGVYIQPDGSMTQYEQPDGVGEGDIDGNVDGAADGSGFSAGLKNAFSFLNIKQIFKTIMTSLMNLLYEASALCIHMIRTFYLIVLVILGPLVLGFSVFDGFQQSLPAWFARYINIYMWLPVANIFGGISGRIVENMSTMDQDFFSSTAYLIFMVISVIGYMMVPRVANSIVQIGRSSFGA